PDHCPDSPRNGPPGPISAYAYAGPSIATAASTLHRPSTGFEQRFAMDFAFQITQACPAEQAGDSLHQRRSQSFCCGVRRSLSAEHGFLIQTVCGSETAISLERIQCPHCRLGNSSRQRTRLLTTDLDGLG